MKRRVLQHIVVSFMLLLMLCGDVHPNPGPGLQRSARHPDRQTLMAGTWNVRTLVESKRNPIRPTAIVARELDRYNIDIAALCETRILGDSTIKENSGGYTFYLKGKPLGDKHYHGVGFAIRTSLVKHLEGNLPVGINERLMTMSLPLKGNTLTIICAYAPTLPQSDEVKDRFYASLTDALNSVPSSHKLLVLGDFNARVGSDHESWEDIIGRHGVGNENSNGTRLLSLCSQNELCITNTFFQQATRYKTTWMHPGSKQWHMIDYVITRRRDIKDVFHTRAMCGSSTWSDHRLVRSKLAFKVKSPQRRRRLKPQRKPDLAKLKSPLVRATLAKKLEEGYATVDLTDATATASWDIFKDITLKISTEILGYPVRKHKDWFDEHDPLIKPMLTRLHNLHIEAIEDSMDAAKADLYRMQKRIVQTSLREMKDSWWKARAAELQNAADRRDFKAFYHGLKAVYGPTHKASPAIKSKDGVLLTEPSKVLDRWAEHFKEVLNQDSNFDMTLLDELPQWDVNLRLDEVPTLKEVQDSITQLSSGKAPGEDGIAPEIYIHGGAAVAEMVLDVTKKIWQEGTTVQEFKDANIVHLYKNKGDRCCCDNHRGISLLCIAGKIVMRLLLNRLFKHVVNIGLIPESQCGFFPGKATTDMIFALRQLQEKCKLHNQDLYLLFIDLTKAFDTVDREGLWCILEKAGCPKHFVGIIRSFHDNMKVTVREGSEKSQPFGVTSGTKQGCVIAPTLFSIFFSMMLLTAFKDTDDGVEIKSRLDVGLGSITTSHFNAESKVILSTIRDLLFADDCALAADSKEALQRLCDCFSAAARRFGLIISIKKTEVLYQPARGNAYTPPAIFIDGTQLKAVELFKYLGSIVSVDASLDADITARIAKATTAFGRLTKRLWSNRDIRLGTKVDVYRAAVVTSLLYGCETWTLKKGHIKSLEKFHQTSLRRIARIKWFHKRTNYEVLSHCKIGSIQSMVESAVLRWTGHVTRMSNDRIPKKLLYGRLSAGKTSRGNHATYINQTRSILRACVIPPKNLEKLAANRPGWRKTYKAGISTAEVNRINHLIAKRERRKFRAAMNPTHQPP
jgi:exonuclease III